MAEINYEDERFTQVEDAKQVALSELEQTYDGMIDEAKSYYQAKIDESQNWAATQSALQQQKTDLAIEQIEQQKDQTKKDYTKEQSGAYADWQKESNKYGVNAEELAAGGLAGTGYGESSQVRMYNTYQNRVATARESYNLAILNYNNAIKEAQLQNNSALAEIAHSALQQQLELSLAGFQYENELVLAQASQKAQIEETYYNRYLDVLDQMNTENALAEQARQYNQNYELQVREFEEGVRQYEEEMARLKELDAQENALALQELELKKAQLEAAAQTSSGNAFIDKSTETTGESSIKGTATSGAYLNGALTDQTKNNNAGYKTSTETPLTDQTKNNNAGYKTGANTRTDSTKNNNIGYSTNPVDKDLTGFATKYYQGSFNPDVEVYGAMANGYQPAGISGHGSLAKSGEKITVTTKVQYGAKNGKVQNVKQNVWEAEDGTKWYWQGVQNKYIQLQ